MTVIDVTALERALGLPGPIVSGEHLITYWAGHSPFVQVDGEEVIFPAPIRVPIVAGVTSETIDLEPTGDACCVKWVVRSYAGGEITRYVTIPDVGPVVFGDLVDVDRMTFVPVDDPASILSTVQQLLLDGLKLTRVTQVEYDALPTPRPGDVLYVITP